MALDSLTLTVPVPCTLGYFGDKLATFQTQLKASEIINLLGHDPRSKHWNRLPDEKAHPVVPGSSTSRARKRNLKRGWGSRVFGCLELFVRMPVAVLPPFRSRGTVDTPIAR